MNKRAKTIRLAVLVASAVLVVLGGRSAWALINPNFTPVHVTEQADLILEVQFGEVKVVKDAKGNITSAVATGTVKRPLKGTYEQKTLVLDLVKSAAFPNQVATFVQLLESKEGRQAVFFASAGFNQNGGGAVAASAFLHVDGTWLAVGKDKNNGYDVLSLDNDMNTTWNGGTDMLVRVTEYILAEIKDKIKPEVPVVEGINWAGNQQLGELKGDVSAAVPVDLAGDGKWSLYVACAGGDRLYKYDATAKELVDATEKVKLTAKSKVAAWGDFNADGRMDLLSFDGAAVTIFTQNADGTFTAGKELLKGKLTDGCLGLTCIDVGKAGQVGVIITTKTSPLLWIAGEGNEPKAIGGAFAGDKLGAPGVCLAADFDADGFVDIIQLFEKGSLLYKGKAAGEFEDAKPLKDVAAGPGKTAAFLGDFEGHGLLDIFALSDSGASKLWNNRGKFEFVNTMSLTGEMSYKGTSGAVGGCVGDFNNDGRQDVFFVYAAEPPHMYFSRGFRSFGLSNGLDAALTNLPNVNDGQQAGCLADFNGDGAQDLAVVLKSGQVHVFYPEVADQLLSLRVGLSSKGPYIGPLKVTAYSGNRCLGAWNVQAGVSEALFGLSEKTEVTLKFQFPGKKPQEKKVVVEKARRIVLEPEK